MCLQSNENQSTVDFGVQINPRFSSTVLYRHLFGFEDLIWSIEDRLGLELSDYRQDAVGRKFYKGYQEYIK